MGPTVPFCDTPEQSAVVGVVAGLLGGAVGVVLGWGPVGVAVAAGVLAAIGDLGTHAVRGDEQFQKALEQLGRR
ncbi:hypothetical protein GJ631_06045 [Natronomonas sp. CBA1123]|jgi:uncharacterized oligopeptide transporter (OPT) family protein|uniref:hypothetical protein n=1 Tax=Natronomonas sp. CBA1123 TaxID=2668070 RepID=UPI0012E99D72|nr:hypothetical protein [Natronomonas sp. CBA1123]MUV86146.1 hypothetical protein [Natronomonas sp. CBA1123]